MTLIEAFRSRWVNIHPLVRVFLVFALLAGGGLPTLQPAYRAIKNWRVERNLRDALQAYENRDFYRARDLSLAVLQSGSPNIEALRIFGKSCEELGDPRHQQIVFALLSHPEATEEDRLNGFPSIVKDSPLGQVGRVWTTLAETSRTQPATAAAFARRLRTEARYREAAQVLLQIPEKQRDAPLRIELARLMIAVANRDDVNVAQQMVVDGLQKDEPSQQSLWLGILECVPVAQLNREILAPLQQDKLRASLSDKAMARLKWADIRIPWNAATEAERSALLSGIGERVAAGLDTSQKSHVIRLLHDLGEHERLLDLFSAGDGDFERSAIRRMWLSAMKAEKLADAKSWMELGVDRFPAYEVQAYRAITESAAGNASTSSTAWKDALEFATTASPSSRELLALYQIARRHGSEESAASAMLAAIRKGNGPLPLYESLLPLMESLAKQGKDQTLMEICSQYRTLEPWNPTIQVQYAYLACLQEMVDPGLLIDPLAALAARLPDELPIHTTLATVLVANGRIDDAATALRPFQSMRGKISPSYEVIFLTVDGLQGVIDRDSEKVSQFPWDQLQPIERRWFTNKLNNRQSEEK